MPSTGTPSAKTAEGACGEAASCTEAGPPERMIALGAKAAIFPADDGYSAAALVSIAVLVVALAVSALFVMRRPEPGRNRA